MSDSPRLAPGKIRRLRRLADADGRFAMLAIDQRGSLLSMIAAQTGRAEAEVTAEEMTAVKRAITAAVAPLATAVLADPLFGYPQTEGDIPAGCGVLLAGEVTGYEAAGDGERRSRLLDGWTVEHTVRLGADAAKLLLWHNPEASAATHAHQQAVVESVGAACAAHDLPFVLEIVTYPMAGLQRGTADWACAKPALVADAAAVYSAPRFGVDLLKLEFPADLKYVEEYRDRPFASGEVVYGLDVVRDACTATNDASAVPWVILSAGVDPDEFVENVGLVGGAGASGFLCGRAVWKRVVEGFPSEARMRSLAAAVAAPAFARIRAANAHARPWTAHPYAAGGVPMPARRESITVGITTRASMLNQTPRARRIVEHLAADGVPFVKAVVERMVRGALPRTTLLAVCPNSEAVLRAALAAAKDADCPVLYAATLNQVDLDGGYTGWTPAAFVQTVADEAERIGLDTPILPCLDHGGPWLKDLHTLRGLNLDQTMAAVKRSLEACLDAGYALLHIDPTVDRTLPRDAPVPIERVVERTLDLLAHAEAHRQARGIAPVAYEVGTEEVHGGLADAAVFDRFLTGLDAGLRARGLAHAWPCFVVGKVGTDLHTTAFDPAVARALTERVRPYGALVKGHYSDFVRNPQAYPLAGMGGANVGPEFTEEETYAIDELAALEREIGRDSGFREALADAVDRSGRWRKWLLPDEEGRALDDLAPERRGWIVRTCARYVWTDPEVRDARARLTRNLRGTRDADAYVQFRIRSAIERYIHRFNLVGLNERLLAGGAVSA
jgi:tagatose 1,6-diphosphate aldolase